MSKLGALVLTAMAMLALPGAAQAQAAYTAKSAHLRAGPARDYPVVAVLPAGLAIWVQGCLADYTWCDVTVGADRGWVYAANISYTYQGNPVPVLRYGPEIGIAIVGFMLLDYWADHYRDRPIYRDRDRWAHRPPAPRVAPPVIGRPAAPRYDAPGAQRPQPMPQGGTAAQHPQPPRSREPDRSRPTPQPPASPGVRQAPPSHQAGPGGQRPQPPQGHRGGAPGSREPDDKRR